MPSDAASNLQPETEKNLLDAAIELYGQHGTQAVSLNQIRKHAKVANEAAIRYYFRNKEGLLARSLDRVAEKIEPNLSALATQLESMDTPPPVRTILMHFGIPFTALFESDSNSLNFLGSLTHEEGETGQKLLAEKFGPVLLRYENLLIRAMPSKAPELVHLHFYLAINLLLHGLSDISLLKFVPSASPKAKSFLTDPTLLVEAFISFVHAGVVSETTPPAGYD